MNKIIDVFCICLGSMVILSGCGRNSGKSESSAIDSVGVIDTVVATYKIDPDLSQITWRGKVIGVYGHHGSINVSEGSLTTKGEEISSGRIDIDMTSIVPLDSSAYQDKEGSRITDLQRHLMTGDFFLTEEYPTASFEIRNQDNNLLTGDLTIKGTTHEETIVLSYLEVLPEGLVGDGLLVFDRQNYGVNWKHTVNDYILADDIEVEIKIVARNLSK